MTSSICGYSQRSVREVSSSDATASETSDIPITDEASLTLLTDEQRYIFTVVYAIIALIGLVANVCVIFATAKKKSRYIQRTCIISLALSDLLALISMATNNLETFSHPMMNWTLGKFMCGAIPVGQVYGILMSSFTLLLIAMDRYRSVVFALNNQWNPQLRSCITGAVLLWIFCGAVSYPMSTYFFHRQTYVISANNHTLHCDLYWLCVSLEKDTLMKYHLSLTVIIFLPILIAFIWFYYKIAVLIWTHRKPPTANCTGKSETETSMTRSTDAAPRSDVDKVTQQMMHKKKNLHVERKIRTLKIVITLLLVFIVCRLPYWVYFALKAYFADLADHWNINYTMICLSLLNCALNPFLYTFLRPTLSSLNKLLRHTNAFLCQVCCCCLSNDDLENFEKEDKLDGLQKVKESKLKIGGISLFKKIRNFGENKAKADVNNVVADEFERF